MRPRAGEVMDHDRGEAAHTATTVFEPEPEPIWIGIYDAAGEKVYAIEEREPIGFRLGR